MSVRFVVGSHGVARETLAEKNKAASFSIKRLFIPPVQLHPFYGPFAAWSAFAYFLGCLMHCLGMHALLTVITVKTVMSPSQTIMGIFGLWLIKEALRQMGGVLGMSAIFQMPDMNPKGARFLSNLLLNVASLAEISVVYWMPLLDKSGWQWWFLLGALALGNGITRHLGFMLSQASRAQILSWLAVDRAAVIGQLTGAASMQATGAGVSCSFFVLVIVTFLGNPSAMQHRNAFTLLGLTVNCLNLWATKKACRYAWSGILNQHQLGRFVETLKTGHRCLDPLQFSKEEPILWRREKSGLWLEPHELQEDFDKETLLKAHANGYLIHRNSIWLVKGCSPRAHLRGIFRLHDVDYSMIDTMVGLGWCVDEMRLTGPRSIDIDLR